MTRREAIRKSQHPEPQKIAGGNRLRDNHMHDGEAGGSHVAEALARLAQ